MSLYEAHISKTGETVEPHQGDRDECKLKSGTAQTFRDYGTHVDGKMIEDIEPAHHDQFLRMNAEFVHWLSPLDQSGLDYILARATYARQAGGGMGALIGYAHDVEYPDHWNLNWLKGRLKNFFYIDRVIIDGAVQGKGLGRQLYEDVEAFARNGGYEWLACEVNTIPDNPKSHEFHLRFDFQHLGDQAYPDFGKAVRYYAKALNGP